jgi:DNA-binding MarR family transcriptional regulator
MQNPQQPGWLAICAVFPYPCLLLTRRPNPGHKRSPLISLSERGAHVYKEVDELAAGWANQLVVGISNNDLQVTLRTLETVCDRLIENKESDGI